MTDKATLRRLARILSPATPDESDRVSQRLLDVFDEARTACLYLPMPGEIDITSLTRLRPDITWHTTRTVDRTTLTVHPFDSEYETHVFGYSQPVEGSVLVEPTGIDAWLVPGLAFDVDGHRLGHGAGYYDRLLAQTGPRSSFIAVTTERRIFPMIPADAFDVTMHVVVTEDRTFRP